MNPVVVNISDMKIATDPKAVLATYSLGSCLGVTVYDPVTRAGGLIHCLLARASAAREKARQNPYMFVTTGVPLMVRKLMQKGAALDRMVFKAAGGANMRSDNIFRTGENNYMALRRLLERNNIKLAAESVGGSIPRSMYLHLDTGRVVIKSLGVESEL
ncbi:chemotaxis protein CheD [Pseudodesulfovibrio senegalensis]|uniref:Probable chemoreceptor glutamine deamidase CheD n=1 Tax=Pseudodesulfovibrio senegalensis TaxID=1721087 RepID=A0A6N6MZS8_9BACT|nr:chemotaxis protein CheD [Pseudodesulfovibrio senegalensis]KAB1439113.1 chemotaxis protein CheD [Pseudodesulfovibrio senegalensis]